ncbi:MAG: phospho-sugar mutase [Clostridiaceae bacterium]|nr:phospho-sugar mutase [Clostridiaceae bacterium]
MSAKKEAIRQFDIWRTDPYFDEATREELNALVDRPEEILSRFGNRLSFGTAGLRGVMAAGLNRMNRYTVILASAAVGEWLLSTPLPAGRDRHSAVIAYDSRLNSLLFACAAAAVLANKGIEVLLYDQIRPVPMLSFSVRYFSAGTGIMVTASHNPSIWNGYKVYGSDGAQLPPEAAGEVLAYMNQIDDVRTVDPGNFEELKERGMIRTPDSLVDEAYYEMLEGLCLNPDAVRAQKDMKIVFTPLHGTGTVPVQTILGRIGFTNILTVPEQAEPDGSFPTVASPNPEDRAALALGLDLAKREEAELLLATDPDSDRLGAAFRTPAGEYEVLNGNQIGIMLLYYILSSLEEQKRLPQPSFVVSTIVSTRLARMICRSYGVDYMDVLTGFRYIGEQMEFLDSTGKSSFLFGFEESFGYLSGTAVRDKDAVNAAMLFAELAAVCRQRNITLNQYLTNIYEKYCYAAELTLSYSLSGTDGMRKISRTMEALRTAAPEGWPTIDRDRGRESVSAGQTALPELTAVADYMTGQRYDFAAGVTDELSLPKSNVLYYELAGEGVAANNWLCVRPSGTEPKLKLYIGAYARTAAAAETELTAMRVTVESLMEDLIV